MIIHSGNTHSPILGHFIVIAVLLILSCGGDRGGAIDYPKKYTDDGGLWLIAWDTPDAARLGANTRHRVILVNLSDTDRCVPKEDGSDEKLCEKVLTPLYEEDCRIEGTYDFAPTPTPRTDTEVYSTLADVYARFPIGAFKLAAQFKKESKWYLSYVLVGMMQASATRVTRSKLSDRCRHATHYIKEIAVGAFLLKDESYAGGGGGVVVEGVGAGTKVARAQGNYVDSGDPEQCKLSEESRQSDACRAFVRVYLEPITEPETCSSGETLVDDVCQPSCEEGKRFVPNKGCVSAPRGPKLVRVEGGSFIMGDNSDDQENNPEHTVTVRTFWMDETEVMVRDYEACVLVSACEIPTLRDPYDNWGKPDRKNHPINRVSATQANQYCAWAGKRLPTEEEWEYAARSAGQTKRYPWGEEEPDCTRAMMISGAGARYGCGLEMTGEVCKGRENGKSRQGICDLAGNVQEWTGTRECPPADKGCASAQWITRGGSFLSFAKQLRSTHRRATGELVYDATNGFRCVKDDGEW